MLLRCACLFACFVRVFVCLLVCLAVCVTVCLFVCLWLCVMCMVCFSYLGLFGLLVCLIVRACLCDGLFVDLFVLLACLCVCLFACVGLMICCACLGSLFAWLRVFDLFSCVFPRVRYFGAWLCRVVRCLCVWSFSCLFVLYVWMFLFLF